MIVYCSACWLVEVSLKGLVLLMCTLTYAVEMYIIRLVSEMWCLSFYL